MGKTDIWIILRFFSISSHNNVEKAWAKVVSLYWGREGIFNTFKYSHNIRLMYLEVKKQEAT